MRIVISMITFGGFIKFMKNQSSKINIIKSKDIRFFPWNNILPFLNLICRISRTSFVFTASR